MSTLTVGLGKQYTTIAAAVAASHAGDVIDVAAGTYTNDFISLNHNLTLDAVGGMVTINATVPPPNGKAIIDEGGVGVSVTINGFELVGAKVADGNGAGIRYEGGSLTLTNDYIHGNQDGLMGAADVNGSILIDHSEFAANGAGDGYTHNIYVGNIANFTLTNSLITGAVVGHEVKSRAANNIIENNRIVDGPGGTASYDIDLPNGGNATISGNVIEKAATAQNPIFISIGEEGGLHASDVESIAGNTFINNDTSPSVRAVNNLSETTASFTSNAVAGLTASQLGSGITSSNISYLTTAPALNLSPPYSVGPAQIPNVDTIKISVESLMHGSALKPAFVVHVDGAQVGGTQTITPGTTQYSTFTLTGDWDVGAHSIEVAMVGATAANGESLLLNDLSYDGFHPAARIVLTAAHPSETLTIPDTTSLFKT